METINTIKKSDLDSIVDDEISRILFDKESARMFINCTIYKNERWFSVFDKGTHRETSFDNIDDCVVFYNSL